ncbi:hypothetical protein EA187_06965 [Lujinxingia sediminis]|uniref:Peptidase C-terminal archaeal/bacterial domain-containing protein n=1 Tax=Lujinxingia sediminis TaxID=2480984 RepID=A0ABY0CVP2_9DELT|nr:PPC domain-containing protein [Lujinxingia sediminis]RVU46868.1 hypothetical protein EA187_06965 [Lujinxingia sediminis]
MNLRQIFASFLIFATTLPAALLLGGCTEPLVEAGSPLLTLDVRSEETYTVGEDVIQINLTGSDPSGLDLTFAVADMPERARFQTFSNAAVFTWDPIASDATGEGTRRLVFSATNSVGKVAERVVHVRILSGNGQPRFVSSQSELYDPRGGQPLRLEVRVRDDDSNQVSLSMPAASAPQGASFEQVEAFEGVFSWLPTPAQLQQRAHTVTFVAEDFVHEPVEFIVTIIVQRSGTSPTPPSEDRCEVEGPIVHTALSTRRGVGDYGIEADIAGGSTRFSEVVLYWTLDDPFSESADFESRPMTLEGKVARASIGNPLPAPGESAMISYTICAVEAEPASEDEAVVCAPPYTYWRFAAYSPDDAVCRDDGVDLSTASQAAPMVREDYSDHRLCRSADKHHRVEVGEGEVLEVVVAHSPGTDLELSFVEGSATFEREGCDGLAVAILDTPGTYVVRARGDEAAYHIGAYSLEQNICPDAAYEPNDAAAMATLLTESFVGLSELAICEADDVDIYAVELFGGDDLEVFASFVHAQGDIDLTLYAPEQSTLATLGEEGVAGAWSSDDDEAFSYTAEASGFYYLRVESVNGPNTYDLAVERICNDVDAFSGNHGLPEAAALVLDVSEANLQLCNDLEDWFSIEVEAGQSVLGQMVVNRGSAQDVLLDVFNEGGGRVAVGEAGTRSVDFDFVAAEAGTYFLAISAEAPVEYDLDMFAF